MKIIGDKRTDIVIKMEEKVKTWIDVEHNPLVIPDEGDTWEVKIESEFLAKAIIDGEEVVGWFYIDLNTAMLRTVGADEMTRIHISDVTHYIPCPYVPLTLRDNPPQPK